MAPSTKLLAAAATATLIAAAAIYSSTSSSTSTDTPTSADDVDVSVDTIVAVFDDLQAEMRTVVEKLSKMLQQIKAQGLQIPEEQLQMHLVGEYEKELTACQPEIYAKHDVDDDEFEAAVNYFYAVEKNDAVVKVVNKFKTMYKQIGGNPPMPESVEAPGHIDMMKFIDMCQDYFNSMTSVMMNIVEATREEHGLDAHVSVPKEHMPAVGAAFEATANTTAETTLKEKYGVTPEQFQALMEKFAVSPQIQQVLQQLQMQQQQQFVQMGISGM